MTGYDYFIVLFILFLIVDFIYAYSLYSELKDNMNTLLNYINFTIINHIVSNNPIKDNRWILRNDGIFIANLASFLTEEEKQNKKHPQNITDPWNNLIEMKESTRTVMSSGKCIGYCHYEAIKIIEGKEFLFLLI
ncbi:MAG: hypothetical protein AABY32_00660 [Nanoarchaeota archaeon]